MQPDDWSATTGNRLHLPDTAASRCPTPHSPHPPHTATLPSPECEDLDSVHNGSDDYPGIRLKGTGEAQKIGTNPIFNGGETCLLYLDRVPPNDVGVITGMCSSYQLLSEELILQYCRLG